KVRGYRVSTASAPTGSCQHSNHLASMPQVLPAMECLAKAGFEDDFVKFYNPAHWNTACDGSGVGLKISDEFGDLTFCNGIVKTEGWRDLLHHRHPVYL
ncbi:MAG: hypothetical protein ACLVIY_15200, partial [Anaerobutyricum soehngenii]